MSVLFTCITLHRYRHKIEIAGGLGDTVGKVWRVGLMGVNSKAENVKKVLNALEEALKSIVKM